jgi:hypothetical protein
MELAPTSFNTILGAKEVYALPLGGMYAVAHTFAYACDGEAAVGPTEYPTTYAVLIRILAGIATVPLTFPVTLKVAIGLLPVPKGKSWLVAWKITIKLEAPPGLLPGKPVYCNPTAFPETDVIPILVDAKLAGGAIVKALSISAFLLIILCLKVDNKR